jgi:hypothetical protein
VRVECLAPLLASVLRTNYEALAVTIPGRKPDLYYSVKSGPTEGTFSLMHEEQAADVAADVGDLLFLIEKSITVELQKRRPDLLFLHSAAIEWHGKACLLAAESGGGKSTTTWALLHHDFHYLSDELSPIDLGSMRVFPYPHALCLKQPPSRAYPLPEHVMHLDRTIHIPARSLPRTAGCAPRPIGAVFLASYDPERKVPDVRSISPAEASARLYVTVLNALAHPNYGLDAVIRIAERVPCFALDAADLRTTCALILGAVEQAIVTS